MLVDVIKPKVKKKAFVCFCLIVFLTFRFFDPGFLLLSFGESVRNVTMLIVSVVISTRDTRLNHFFLSICNSHSLGHISSEAASLFVFDHFAGFCFSEGDAGKIKQKGHRSGAVVEPDSCGHVAAQRECPIAGAQSLNCRYTRPMVVVVRGHKN